MKYLDPKFSVGPAAKSTAWPRCVWGDRYQHAEWCAWAPKFVRGGATWVDIFDPEKWRGVYESEVKFKGEQPKFRIEVPKDY